MPADPPTARELAERCEALLRDLALREAEDEPDVWERLRVAHLRLKERRLVRELGDEWLAFLETHPELDDLASLGDDDDVR